MVEDVFSRDTSASFWIKFRVPEHIPGGPYWNEKDQTYSIPVSLCDYQINKNGLALIEFPSNLRKERMKGLEKSIKDIKEIIITRDLGLRKGDSFEIWAHSIRSKPFYKDHMLLAWTDISKIIIEYPH